MRLHSSAAVLPIAMALATLGAGGASTPLVAQTVTSTSGVVQLSTGRGRLVTLTQPMSDVFVADDKIADVQVRSPRQLYIFAKGAGETSLYATNKAGKVVYSTAVRVGNNYDSVNQMLGLAMPDSKIVATPMNGIVLLTGTVATPEDAAEAERLTQAFVGDSIKILSRLRNATPLQVNLQVKFAEVSRNFVKQIGVNLASFDGTGGFKFGVGQGRGGGGGPQYTVGGGLFNNVTSGSSGTSVITKGAQSLTLGMAGHLLGLDLLSSIDLGETTGQVTTLANPNLTALSGETGTFLAGGEVPIPVAQSLGAVSVEYKQYGVSLAYTPTVLSDGRISMRVRPEVSQLDYANAVTLNGTRVPGITSRRAETTVVLGSGQSFMIGGLLQNLHNNSVDKAPFLGDLPILGALFRSNSFQRNETELVIVITPYLVKPMDANAVVLPTDAYKAPTDTDRIISGQLQGYGPVPDRPRPTVAPPAGAAPAIGAVTMPGAPAPAPAHNGAPVQADKAIGPKQAKRNEKPVANPGFSFN